MQDVDSKPSALSAVACFHHEPLVSTEGLVARVEATAQSRVSPGLQPQGGHRAQRLRFPPSPGFGASAWNPRGGPGHPRGLPGS